MSQSRPDSARAMLISTIVLAVISVAMYLIIFLTLFQYGVLNDTGRGFALIAMLLSALAMLLACYLAFTSRNRTLTSPGLSGLGWVLICCGLVVGAPALGISGAFPGSSFGGVPAALFLIIAGAAVLQAERNARQAAGDEPTRLN